MPIKVTTLEQAQALPLAAPDYVTEILPSGETVRHRTVATFYPRPTDADQILYFTDTDGELMFVDYEEHGPVKRAFP